MGGVEKPGKLKAPPALLNWKTVNEKMPWNIVFLLGGGFALARGSEVSKPCPLPNLFRGEPVAGEGELCFCGMQGRPAPHIGHPFVTTGVSGYSHLGGGEKEQTIETISPTNSDSQSQRTETFLSDLA